MNNKNSSLIDPGPVRSFTRRANKRLFFNSENINPQNLYVVWIDIMGAQALMETSMHKAANAIARLHASVELASDDSKFGGKIIRINDGVFIIDPEKKKVMEMLQRIFTLLASRFVETTRSQDKTLIRSGIAYGPVVFGEDMKDGFPVKKLQKKTFLQGIAFGPAISRAYKAEGKAPPFGVHIDISARSFASLGDKPFQMVHWLWWQQIDGGHGRTLSKLPSLPNLRVVLREEVEKYFQFLEASEVFLEIGSEKITKYRDMANQYLSA